jgi:tRNA threonylcarbamoyladenosine modification (KEOPS) complex  Pcc1 subunit
MQFEAILRLPCKNPELISTAICNEDAEVNRSSVTYTHDKDHLEIRIHAGEAKHLNKCLNSIMSRFRLSVDTVEMCESLLKT